MARAAANVSGLQLAMRIPKRNLSRTDTEYLHVRDMCALSADEVLLACGAAGLRAVSLQNAQLAAYEPTALQNVNRVGFDTHTDTLLLLVKIPTSANHQLVSLRHNASEWLEVQRLGTRTHSLSFVSFAVCDSRVLLVERETMYVFDVRAERILRDAGSVPLQSGIYDVSCTLRDGVTLVALSPETSVSLLRLTSLPLRLEPLASVSLTAQALTAGSCFARTCCSLMTGTAPLTRAPSCRFSRLTTRSLSGESSSRLKSVFTCAPVLSRATDLFSSMGVQWTSSSMLSHEQLAREHHIRIEEHFCPASAHLSHFRNGRLFL